MNGESRLPRLGNSIGMVVVYIILVAMDHGAYPSEGLGTRLGA
jgi:hypothetical protein